MSAEKATDKAADKATKMATENEKLCMAIITHSSVTNINWQGVADELGIDKIPTVQKRWSRFKTAKFGTAGGSAPTSSAETTPVKKGKPAAKKRGAVEMNGGNDAAQVPKRPKTPRKPWGPKGTDPKMDEDDAKIDEKNGHEIGQGATEDADDCDENDESLDDI